MTKFNMMYVLVHLEVFKGRENNDKSNFFVPDFSHGDLILKNTIWRLPIGLVGRERGGGGVKV